ncbi:hypothetical protein LTR56_026653 [Elasticomyces elasticus]|nr:hypothetical protein LTR56_026653 [Elasticomyces elasticus]KAK3662829.1 hypothetical protein LTR22_006232 [Elasticomyces elasticus]KAK4930024.1 hypothetical protein LTR49_003352 [Elasticomyces elasticus]KAK5749179.1 hypothetical protein LTS12_020747 [Elasticomyces elasticus]
MQRNPFQQITPSNDTAWLDFLRTAGDTLPEHNVKRPLPCTCAGKVRVGWEPVHTPDERVYIDRNTNTVSRHDPRCITNTVSRHDARCITSYEICYARQRYTLATTGNVLLPEEGSAPDGALWCATFNAMVDYYGKTLRDVLPPPNFPGSPSREQFLRVVNRYRKDLLDHKARIKAGMEWLTGYERDEDAKLEWAN